MDPVRLYLDYSYSLQYLIGYNFLSQYLNSRFRIEYEFDNLQNL